MPKLRPGEKVLRPVRPNAGIAADYRARLRRLVEAMQKSYLRFVLAAYRQNPPRLAQDAAPAIELQRTTAEMAERWERQFDEAAPRLARWFATSVERRSQAALRQILKDGGFTVSMPKLSRTMRDVLEASVAENVSLIKSIPQQFHTQIEGMVMRSVQAGRDLEQLSRDLKKHFGVTDRRAAFIARDQNQKATAVFTRVRQQELGIDEAIWMHSGGGKTKRKTHVTKSGGRFSIRDGWHDPDPKVNRRIWPGELPNCFPADEWVRLKSLPTRLWRAPFHGPMVDIKVGSYLLKGTANHPILTGRGWVGLGDLDSGDQVVCVFGDEWKVVDDHEQYREACFGDLFETLAVEFGYVRRDHRSFDFHGDRPHSYVDEIFIDHDLSAHRKATIFQKIGNLALPHADAVSSDARLGIPDHVVSAGLASLGNPSLSFGGRLASVSHRICRTSVSHDAGPIQNIANVGRCMAWDPDVICNGSGAHTKAVQADNLVSEGIPVAPLIDLFDADSPELLAQLVRIAADRKCSVFQVGAVLYEFRRVSNKRIRDFSGHVFTLETRNGYFTVGDAQVQAKNCRCVSRSIVKGFS